MLIAGGRSYDAQRGQTSDNKKMHKNYVTSTADLWPWNLTKF